MSTDDDNINIFAGFPSTITKTFGINTPVSTIEQEFMTVIQSVISSANIKIIENNLIGKEFTFNT